jgi:hypothetical protein
VGNGLRVVTGAAVASGGSLEVESRGRRFEIKVHLGTGRTEAVEVACNAPTNIGTKVTIRFGAALARSADDGKLARQALRFPGPACEPMRSHVGWYDARSWLELAQSAPVGTTVARLLALMGIENNDQRAAVDVGFAEIAKLKLPLAPKLLPCGAAGLAGADYAKAEAPGVLIEAWAMALVRVPPSRLRSAVRVFVNRTPVVLPATIGSGGYLWLGGEPVCQLQRVELGCDYAVELSVAAPHVPIVNDGKTPDLRRWGGAIAGVLESVLRRAYRRLAPPRRRGDIREAAFQVMAEAYLKASANGTLPANARQVMYAARPLIAKLLGPDRDPVDDKYFTQVLLPDYVAENEDECAGWDIVYDARGHLVEPHTGHRIPLGTEAVRGYLLPRQARRESLLSVGGGLRWQAEPRDRYRTALFIEKEGFGPLLQAARIAERFDCAILSTKGMSVVACRHLLDRLGRDGTVVLVAHDFDRAGLAIAHTLGADGRRYTFEHTPRMADIGLRLDDVTARDLQDEPAPDAGPGPGALRAYGATDDEIAFLCGRKRRVELNAMTSDQFIFWLESRLSRYGAGKVVPDTATLEAKAREAIAAGLVRERAAAVEAAAWAEAVTLPPDLARRVRATLATHPELSWEAAVERQATARAS